MRSASRRRDQRDMGAPFQGAALADSGRHAGRRSLTLAISALLHALFAATLVVLPLVFYEAVAPEDTLGAFLVSPLQMPAPPPPPPLLRGDGSRRARVPPGVEPPPPHGLVAPRDVPGEITAQPAIDLGWGGGDPNGVEGGVPDGIVGSIVGDLPPIPEPPPKVVRVGGRIEAPERVRYVPPRYPELAIVTHTSATLILEAQVDVHGVVKAVRVLRGHPLFDDVAVEAVRQWRYRPLLLNGEATEFVLTVTVGFNISNARS